MARPGSTPSCASSMRSGLGRSVARLMKAAGIAGVRPKKRWRTTIRIPGITPATDLVNRDFKPAGPNVLWVAGARRQGSKSRWGRSATATTTPSARPSIHATIKKEKIYRQSWPTRAEARSAIFEYIEGWYNPRRRTPPSTTSPRASSSDSTPSSPSRRSRHRFRPTDRSRRPRRGPQTGLQRVRSRRQASISLPTARSLPRTPRRPNAVPLRPRPASQDTNGSGRP